MDRETEFALADELRALKASKTAFLDDRVSRNAVEHYTSNDRLQQEQRALFRRLPHAVAHVSELVEPGAFVIRQIAGLPILITRDQRGGLNAFLNVCRHRGTRLVDEDQGCRNRFSCPYHAWTYSSAGDLIAAPHFDQGFPDMDKGQLALTRVGCQQKFGLVWVTPTPGAHEHGISDHFDGLESELERLNIADMAIAGEEIQVRNANWKILVEGGLEAYHFRVAHRTTIGPHFEDNLSSYRAFGPHIRSIIPRTSLATDPSDNNWALRHHANILYTLFPTTQLLVLQDHVAWIWAEALAPDQTRLRLVTLAPKDRAQNASADPAHWTRNHQLTTTTLNEDFTIGESIQAGAMSGANWEMLFGRFEGALNQFNRTIDAYLAK